MAMTKIQGLQMWCKKMAEGYPLVDIVNFTTAWRDGLAFCAIIHRFRPDLIDFHSLSPENVFENCQMAFEIAERELNIPAFLEAEDMVSLKVPDKLSIITYVSQYYNYLHALPQLGGPNVKSKVSTKTPSGTKRPTAPDASQAPIIKKASTESKENLAPEKEKQTAGTEKCAICQNHVYLVERLMEGGKLYHRSCFRHSELSPANKVLTRSPFLSPSLSFDTQNSTSLTVGSKSLGVGNSSKTINNAPKKVSSDTSSTSKGTENVGLKHHMNEISRDITKRSKIQPKILFDDKQSEKNSLTKDNISTQNLYNKNIDSSKSVLESNKEIANLKKNPEDILMKKKTVELSKVSEPSHQKVLSKSDISKSIVSATEQSPAFTVNAKKNFPESNLSAAVSKFSSPAVSTFSRTPVSTSSSTSVSTSSSTAIPNALSSHHMSQPNSEIIQSKYKISNAKDNRNPSNENKEDIANSKANPLPSIHNLQKLFSKSDLDLSEPQKSSQPVPRPRSGTQRSISVEQNNALTKSVSDNLQKGVTPRAVPRKNIFDTSVPLMAPNQPEISAQNNKLLDSNKINFEAKRLPTADCPPPLPESEPPSFVNSFSLAVTHGEKDRDFQESKSPEFAAKHTKSQKDIVLNTYNSQEINDSNKSSAKNNMNEEPKGNKADDVKVLSGLLTSLAGVRRHVLTSPAHTNQPASKNSASSFDNEVKTENVTTATFITPVITASTTISTPSKLQLNSLSQTVSACASKTDKDSTTKRLTNDEIHVKAKNEKSVVIKPQNDSIHLSKTLSSKDNNKIKVSAGAFASTLSANSTSHKESANAFASNQLTNSKSHVKEHANAFISTQSDNSTSHIKLPNKIPGTETKLSRLEKSSNDSSKSAPSYTVNAKESGSTKVQSQKSNENNDFKSAGKNTSNLKEREKKSEYKDSLSDAKLISRNATDSNTQLSNKNKALSSSKENLMSINNVKLKVVMPDRKVVQEPKAAVYDIKLRKVDVIKGDTKWDNVTEIPSESVFLSERNVTKNVHFDNLILHDQTEGPVRFDKKLAQNTTISTTKESQSSVENSQTSELSNEVPQWKKDIEERKQKFRSQSEMNQSKQEKGDDNKINLEKKLDIDKMKAVENEIVSDKELSLNKTQLGVKSFKKDSFTNGEPKGKLSQKKEHGDSNKLDWQVEAEKRMAALAGFDTEVVEQLKDLDKSDILSANTNQQNKSSISHLRLEDITATNNKTNNPSRKNNGDRLMGGDSIVQNKNNVFEKANSKIKESGMEFVLNKVKLKSVEADIDILQAEKIGNGTTYKSQTIPEKAIKGEDFRDILHHLKRVPTVESDETDIVKTKNSIDLQSEDHVLPSAVVKPSQNSNVNKNNNTPITTQQIHVSGVEIINKFSTNDHTPFKTTNLKNSTDVNGNKIKTDVNQLPKEKPAAVKSAIASEKDVHVRKKISTLDDKIKQWIIKNAATSPPDTPTTHRKKILVTTKFDFEQSSDFENSLTKSTAKLTIQDMHTPQHPHQNDVVVSPKHISAIELQAQLQNIDTKLTELEIKGREIEESIRKANSIEDDDDQLMIEWFSLINERNGLVRKEADLIYISREQDLETEQEKIENQLRYLMSKPDECKSPEEKEEEEYLIQHKVNLVEQRNKIVDCMDEDRIRHEIEDMDIEVTLKKKGFWKDSTGTLTAMNGRKVGNSVFYL